MHPGQELTIVSPDAGGVERARAYAKRLDADLAIIDKRRSEDGHAEVMHVVGDVRDKHVHHSGRYRRYGRHVAAGVTGAARTTVRRSVLACAVHGVLSGPALQRIEDSELEQVIVTNTIPLRPECESKKIQVLSVAPLLGRAIQSIHQETSVSSLFV